MQTVYIGDTLINDVFLGSQRMADVASKMPTLVTSGLTIRYDAAFSASAANWRAIGLNLTASLSQTAYQSTAPQYYNITGSLSNITFIQSGGGMASASLNGTGARTVLAFIYPKPSSSLDNNIIWTGGIEDNRLLFQITSGSSNYLKLESVNGSVTSSVATQLGTIPYNQWNQIAYTTNGTDTFNGIDIWLNNNKQSLSGSAQWLVNGVYLEASTFSGQKPYYGYYAAQLVYNRKLTDAEIQQNYQYFQYRFGNI